MNARDASKQYVKGLDEVIAFFNSLSAGALKRPVSNAAQAAAQRVAELIRAKYRSYGRGRGWGYQAARRGKEKGVWPYKLPMPLSHVGMQGFARFVTVSKVADQGYIVQIDPLAVHIGTGKSLRMIAHGVENPPASVTVRKTHRSFVYWLLIQEKRGGYGTRKGAHRVVPDIDHGVYVFTPPQRPVWRLVAQDIVSKVLPEMVDRHVIKRLTAMAKAYGAKVG